MSIAYFVHWWRALLAKVTQLNANYAAKMLKLCARKVMFVFAEPRFNTEDPLCFFLSPIHSCTSKAVV